MPKSQRSQRSRRVLVAVLAAVAALAVGVIALFVAGTDDSPDTAATAGDDPGVVHVHGLGINSADGALIVATHLGLFRIPADGDDAERIGDSFQDTMGFTVVEADHFLGSGHPDVKAMQKGQPTRLGLIESTDAGSSWRIVSLGGEADFHALAFAHGQVYGWDVGSGRFMVSSDRHRWDTRSQLNLYGFAVDPDDADHIVGAAPEGVTESMDGGRTWRPTDGPRLVAMSWHTEAGLWGADAGGAAWHRGANGWERAGVLPGKPQAFLAADDALYAAAHDADDRTAIYRSGDGGRTWDVRYRDPRQ